MPRRSHTGGSMKWSLVQQAVHKPCASAAGRGKRCTKAASGSGAAPFPRPPQDRSPSRSLLPSLARTRRGMEIGCKFDYLSAVSETAPRVFDPALARRRLVRAKVEPSLFLAHAVAEEVAHRSDLIRREFAVTLVHGLGREQTARKLDPARHPRIITA